MICLGAPRDKIAVNPTTNTIYVTNATTDYSHNSTVVVIDGNTNKVMANNLKCSTKDKGVNKKCLGIIFMNEGLLIIQISS